MAYPFQTLIVRKPGKKKKPGPMSMPVELVNPDGTPFVGSGDAAISSVQVTVDNKTGTPSCTGTVEDGVLKLDFKNLKGATGAAGANGKDGTSFTKCAAVPDVSGDDAAAAITTVNALLASLRDGGVLNAS